MLSRSSRGRVRRGALETALLLSAIVLTVSTRKQRLEVHQKCRSTVSVVASQLLKVQQGTWRCCVCELSVDKSV